MRGRRPAAAVLALVTAVALGSAAGASGSARQQTTIRVGFFGLSDESGVGDRIAFATLQRRTGIRTSFTDFASPQAAIIAVTRGDVDMAFAGLHSTVQAIRQDAPLRALLAVKQANEWSFVADVDSLAALRRKRIGYERPGTETQAFATILVKRAGMAASDVTLIAVPGSPNRAAALAAGRLDAAWLNYVDFLRITRAKSSLRVLAEARRLVPFSALQVLVVSDEYLRTHRTLLHRVVSGLLAGYEHLYTAAGRRQWIALAQASVFKDDPDLASAVYANYRLIGFWPRRTKPVTFRQWQSRVRFWSEEGIIESPPSFTRVWDLSFWRRAAARKETATRPAPRARAARGSSPRR